MGQGSSVKLYYSRCLPSNGRSFFVFPTTCFNFPYQENMPEFPRAARRVLLIGWDAADWKLIDKYMGMSL
jgi:hypothetical protein